MPTRARFDGTPLPDWATFEPEGYRSQINVAIDQIWTAGDAWNVTESNQLLAFFTAQGITTYGKIYSLDGTMVLETDHEPSLVVSNGITAVASTNADRSELRERGLEHGHPDRQPPATTRASSTWSAC